MCKYVSIDQKRQLEPRMQQNVNSILKVHNNTGIKKSEANAGALA